MLHSYILFDEKQFNNRKFRLVLFGIVSGQFKIKFVKLSSLEDFIGIQWNQFYFFLFCF